MSVLIACIVSRRDPSHLVLILNNSLIYLIIFDGQKSIATAPTPRENLDFLDLPTTIPAETCISNIRRLSFFVGDLDETRRCHMR